MEFVSPIFDLYSDYLLVNQGQPTATRLAALVSGKPSHDAITRSLHQQAYDSRHLWQVVKPFVQQIAHAQLEPAWHHQETEAGTSHFFNPLVVKGKMIALMPTNKLVALNPANGELLWSFTPDSTDISNWVRSVTYSVLSAKGPSRCPHSTTYLRNKFRPL